MPEPRYRQVAIEDTPYFHEKKEDTHVSSREAESLLPVSPIAEVGHEQLIYRHAIFLCRPHNLHYAVSLKYCPILNESLGVVGFGGVLK